MNGQAGGYTRETVRAVARRMFPRDDPATILELLDLSDAGQSEAGRARVHLAILKLSGGNPDKLLQSIIAARRDWRDVLLWSGAPMASEEAQVEAFVASLLG